MSRVRKWLSLAMATVLIFGGLPLTGLGPAHSHAATYTIVTLTGTTPSNAVQNVVLNGSQLQLGTGAAAKFVMTDWGDGTVSLRAQANGMFVTASGTNDLTATATAVKMTETFKKESSGSAFTLKSLSNSKYLTTSSPNNGNNATTTIKANSDAATDAKQKFNIIDVSPASSKQEIRVLEITDDGTSDLLPILGGYNNPVIKIDSIRMKQFVAQRDELDGRYDAIYIGKGAYNATLVSTSGQNHDTKSIMNDITNLKMGEIQKYYIDRGLPVIVYSQKTSSSSSGALYQNKAGILNAALLPYATALSGSGDKFVPASNKSNVIFVGDSSIDSAGNFLTKTDLINRAAERPRLVVTGKPIDYTVNQNQIYVAGDTLTYTFDVANVGNIAQRSMTANLYIGIDSVLKFDSNNLIVSQPVTSTTGNTLTFRLPKGYSGVHYWKLELVDQGSKLKDIQSGVLRFRDEVTKINVLQVVTSNADTTSSLLKSNNMNQSYLKTEDYEIAITVMSMNNFNNSGYTKLNGYYDMLIFGFADSYNGGANISATAAAAVNAYIATGQSVMFTHDTIYQGSSNWISYFQTATGQLSPMTNMGLNAPNQSTTTKKVNDGLLTRFPFNISSVITQVNTTHDQYFGLKLEDPNLIPWYNITGGPRDDDDSWNHYYTYSYGNVTYSGTGHTNHDFPDWEQRLFVNTMYRAFIGSNHAPIVNVSTPTNYADTGKIIPSYNKVLLSYTPQDYDVIDRSLSTAVTFKYRATASDAWTERQVKAYTDVKTGEIVTESYDNPLPNGGDLVIYVTARDKSGASTTQTITTKVVKVTANVDLTRTLSANVVNNQIEKNVPFTMTYTITPKNIPYQNGISADDLLIKNFKLDEKLPANLEVIAADASPLLLNPAVAGTLASGYKLTGSLADIQYRLSPDRKNFIADPVSFTVKATPKQNGSYLLDNSYLNFTDFYVNGAIVTKDIERSLQFQPYQIQAVTKMASLSLPDTVIAKGDESILAPVIGPDDTSNKTLTWTTDHPELVTVDAKGVIKGIAEGTAKITATATDGSGLTAVSNVTVVVPGINVVGPNTVNVDDTINLEAKLILANETLTGLTWSVGSGQSAVGELGSGADDMKKTLTGVNAGPIDITVVATTSKDKTYTKTYRVTVIQPIQLTLPAEVHIGLGTEWKRDLWNTALGVTPEASKTSIQSYTTWTSGDAAIVEAGASNGVVIGKKTGSVTVGASYQKNPKTTPVTASTRVAVVDLSVPEQVTLGKGKTLDVKALVGAAPAEVSSTVLSRLTWTDESGKNFASVGASTGIVSGTAAGVENVTVTYRQTDGGPIVIQKTIQVNVVDISGPSDVLVAKGDKIDLAALIQVLPGSLETGIREHLSWSSEAAGTALVGQDGVATGKGAGTSKITVSYREKPDGPVIAEWTLNVHVVDLSLKDSVTLAVGGSYDLNGAIVTANPSSIVKDLKWSDEPGRTYASVDAATGIVTGNAPGSETITVTYALPGNSNTTITKTIAVNVVKLDGRTATIPVGMTVDLKDLLAIKPDSLDSQIKASVTWSEDVTNSTITVSNSTATGKRVGKESVAASYRPDPARPSIDTSVQVEVIPVDLNLPETLTIGLWSEELNYDFDLSDSLGIEPVEWRSSILPYITWSNTDAGDKVGLSGSTIRGLQAGNEHISAVYANPAAPDYTASGTVNIRVVGLSFDGPITIGNTMSESLASHIKIEPEARRDEILPQLHWSVESGNQYLTVSNTGTVTGETPDNKPGNGVILVTYAPKDAVAIITAKIEVNVDPVYLGPATSKTVRWNQPAIDLLQDDTLSKLPADIKSKLHWTIKDDNKSVLTGSSLTPSKTGTATVTVAYRKTDAGPDIAKRVFTINIVELSLPASLSIASGATYDLKPGPLSTVDKLGILPTSGQVHDAIAGNLKWSDEGKNNLTVDNAGIITAKINNSKYPVTETVTVSYKPSDGAEIKASVIVSVLPAVQNKPTYGGNKY
ncbi:Ig-like domain (group 2) [Cohnella sp. OV330]|uniref:DUF5057 domain-containing protein n=1 Tax=Cohnella sp. OV330 TaxID=1855288 RepID=UPI0008E1616C|nr:DUF5057 domain-containing protein [Cohnella sp. OV330]SFA94663.1 Ig-like domain (group 2) [Cohnella sp. OV330]